MSWAKIAASAPLKSSMMPPIATTTSKPKFVAKPKIAEAAKAKLVEASKPTASPWASPKPNAAMNSGPQRKPPPLSPRAAKATPFALTTTPPTPKMMKATLSKAPPPKPKSKSSSPKDPFVDLDLVPKTLKGAVVFDVERMEAELAAMDALGMPHAYSEDAKARAKAGVEERKAGLVVQRGFAVEEKVDLGGKVGVWGRRGKEGVGEWKVRG